MYIYIYREREIYTPITIISSITIHMIAAGLRALPARHLADVVAADVLI